MSQENVEIVRRGIEAFDREDFDLLAQLCHEDFEFVSVLAGVDAAGATYRGSEAWREYFAVMRETWESWRVEDVQVFDAGGNRLAVLYRLVGTGQNSGVPVEREVGASCMMRDGKLWRWRSHPNPADALAAVGLSE